MAHKFSYDEYDSLVPTEDELAQIDIIEDASNPLEDIEASAIQEEEFSEPEGLIGPNADIGFVDEEIVGAEMTEDGAGANFYPVEAFQSGMHTEDPAYSIEAYDGDDEYIDTQNQTSIDAE